MARSAFALPASSWAPDVGAAPIVGPTIVGVVHSAAGAPADVVAALRDGSWSCVAVEVGRRMLADVGVLAPHVVVVVHSRGFDLARVCRDVSSAVDARIVVVAQTTASDALQVAALDAGADDFLPFGTSAQVLQARIRALLRRRAAGARPSSRINVGDVTIDLDAHLVYIEGSVVNCPPLLFVLLVTLASHQNRLVERDALVTALWGMPSAAVDPNRLRTKVSALRNLLGSAPLRPRVESVSHLGYRLVVGGGAAA